MNLKLSFKEFMEFIGLGENSGSRRIAIYSKNAKEYQQLIELLNGYGLSYKNAYSYQECVFIYKDSKELTHDRLSYAKNSGVRVLTFQEVYNKVIYNNIFSLEDLKSGMEVVLRDGIRCAFLKNTGYFYSLVDGEIVNELIAYSDDLTHLFFNSNDIMEIFTEEEVFVWSRREEEEIKELENQIERLTKELNKKKERFYVK